jgi:hypothetical protein
LALRSSSDIANVLKEFAGLDEKSANAAMTCVPQKILDRVQNRNRSRGSQGVVGLAQPQIRVLLPDAKRKNPGPTSEPEQYLKKVKESSVSAVTETNTMSIQQVGSGDENSSDDDDGGFLAL